MGKRRDEVRALLDLRDQKGLTFAELSELCGEPCSTLAWWSRKLRAEGAEGQQFAAVELVDAAAEDIELRSKIRILCSGHVIEVEAGFDAELLRQTVKALSAC